MGKQTKWKLCCERGAIPKHFDRMLANADETELRLLVGLLLVADEDGLIEMTDELAASLGMTRAEADGTIRFWKGAGLLCAATAGGRKKGSEKPSAVPAHRQGAVERTGEIRTYETAELASLLESREVTAQFVDEAQRVAGKTFNAYDTSILVGLVHQFGFEEEAVLAILAYVRGAGKKGIRYVEKVALGFYDEGLTSYGEVQERINRMERSGELLGKIKHLYGFGDRELSATEKKLFLSWVEVFGYDLDVIRMAYEITVDNLQQPVPKYTNKILESWHAQKLRTPDEIRAYEQAQKAERSPKKDSLEKSYDLDDFFEAALQRSYDETPT